ncbi:MAG: hypothetical protein COA68_12445 [Oceanobacter sp.]|nr:MAG: hypothetical protein COA68_12445 [Oceanobacter sp.]
MSYAAVASANVSVKRLRVPAWAVAAGVPVSSAPLLPLDLSTAPLDDPSVFYAVRLRDAFSDALSLRNGERGYVLAALARCIRAWVVPAACRDPLLILNGVLAAPPVLKQPTDNTVFLRPPAAQVEIPGLPAETFYSIQPLTGTGVSADPLFSKATPGHFKTFGVLAVGAAKVPEAKAHIQESIRSGLVAAMPRDALVTGGFSHRVCQFRLEKAASPGPFAQRLGAVAAGTFIQGKGSVRALFPDKIAEDTFKKLVFDFGEDCAEIWSEDFRFHWKKPREKTAVIVKRADGNPITEEAAGAVAKALALEKPTVRGGALFGRTPRAKHLHETTLAGIYSVLWLAANDAETEAEPKSGQEEGEREGEEDENGGGQADGPTPPV